MSNGGDHVPRRPRLHLEGGFYHVIARGDNKETIFHNSKDYFSYLSLLDKYIPLNEAVLHGYVLMPNHIHLIVEAGTKPLSKFMQVVQQTYTQGYNRRYERVGHVFQGRYKAFLIDEDSYLLALIRYIHLNPVRADICVAPEQYPWSSHHHYATGEGPGRVETAFVTSVLSTYGGNTIDYYQLLPDDVPAGDSRPLPVQPTSIQIEGTKSLSIDDASLVSILKVVEDITGVEADQITGSTRPREVTRARHLFIYCATVLAEYQAVEVAHFLEKTASSITIANRMFRDRLRRGDTELRAAVESVRVALKNLTF